MTALIAATLAVMGLAILGLFCLLVYALRLLDRVRDEAAEAELYARSLDAKLCHLLGQQRHVA